jgi:hypothetical protein
MDYKLSMPNKPLNSSVFFDETGFYLQIRDGELYVVGDCTKAEAEAALAAHNPPAPTEPTVEQKLASVGLSVDDLKTALGL